MSILNESGADLDLLEGGPQSAVVIMSFYLRPGDGGGATHVSFYLRPGGGATHVSFYLHKP